MAAGSVSLVAVLRDARNPSRRAPQVGHARLRMTCALLRTRLIDASIITQSARSPSPNFDRTKNQTNTPAADRWQVCCSRYAGSLVAARASRSPRSTRPNGSGTCGHRQRQISKARQTSMGSAFVLRPRYLAVLSILAWPSSARTVCKSPVPFKMWRAFVRRNDFTL